MPSSEYFPHIELLLRALHITRERLLGSSRIAVDARLLRALLQAALRSAPFDAEFYATTYPDIAEAVTAGKIPDLHGHYLDSGYFEGRLGAATDVDEAYYLRTYPDVAAAIRRGDVESAADHYTRAGAAEGRIPRADAKADVERWNTVLQGETARRF